VASDDAVLAAPLGADIAHHHLYYANAFEPLEEIQLKFSTTLSNALHLADEYLPTVILLALSMGNEEAGLQDLKAIRSNPSTRDVPVVVLSDSDSPLLEPRLRTAGATDLLGKTTELSLLVKAIRSQSRSYLDTLRGDIPKVVAVDQDVGPARVLMIDDYPLGLSALITQKR